MYTVPVFSHYCGCRWSSTWQCCVICSAGYNVRYVSIPISLAITNVDQYLILRYHFSSWYISQNNVQIQVQTGALSTMHLSWLCLIHCIQYLLCKMLCTYLLLVLDNKNGHINPCLIPFTKSCMQYCHHNKHWVPTVCSQDHIDIPYLNLHQKQLTLIF